MLEVLHDAILGTSPPMEMINDLMKRRLGSWTGGFVDKWSWNSYAVKELDSQEALLLYSQIKAGNNA